MIASLLDWYAQAGCSAASRRAVFQHDINGGKREAVIELTQN